MLNSDSQLDRLLLNTGVHQDKLLLNSDSQLDRLLLNTGGHQDRLLNTGGH